MSDHPYRVVVAGYWQASQIHSGLAPSSFAPSAQVAALVDAAWTAACARPGVTLFDGPVLRLEAWSADPQGFHVAGSVTSYRWFFGTNGKNAHQLAMVALANAVGTSAALVSADGWLLFGRRAATLALYPGFAHPLGGMVEVTEAADLAGGMVRELTEEIGCTAVDLTELALLGLGVDLALGQPELTWLARTRLDRATLEARLDAAEHAGTWSVAATPAAVEAALAATDVTAITRITLLLYGHHAFGPAWFARVHPPGISTATSASPAR